MQALFENYLAVLLAAGTGVMLVLTAIIATKVLAPFSASRAKATPYECGMLPIGRVRTQIHVRYYVYAILFLIFDVEAVFLFPWAVSVVDVGEVALYSMILFILILAAGLGYAWKKGVLEWK
jgi:NADH-quinone oxidoreductase subunit A